MEWRFLPGLFFCVFLILNNISFGQETFSSKSDSIACDTFPPPRNLDWMTFDNLIEIIWEIPLIDTNLVVVPDNLWAYKIIKDGEEFDTVPNQGESTVYYYDDLGTGYPSSHEYYVCALYELDSCGLPSQIGESDCEGPVIGYGYGGFILSFYEDWSTGSFDPNLWEHDEYWHVTGQYGNPMPCATFCNDPDSAYRQELISYWIDCITHPGTEDPYIDGDIHLEFDIELNHTPSCSTDFLDVELLDSTGWNNVHQYSADMGSFAWTNQNFNVTDLAKGNFIKISFVAHGDSGLNNTDWYIDNIKVYRQCNPPRELHWVMPDDLMAWTAPLPHTPTKGYRGKGLQGYNIYIAFNSQYEFHSFTPDTFHTVDTVGWNGYYVTAVYEDCEPASNEIFGPQEITYLDIKKELRAYPNPCKSKLTIESSVRLGSIQIFNSNGAIVYHKQADNLSETIATGSFPAGIYYLKVQTKHSTRTGKVIIHH